jgi:uncharacterized damage-inducible protein DinB
MVESLTFSPEDARAIYEYNRAVFERFVRRVRRLPGRRATRKRGIGHESLLATLVHILNVHEVWFEYVVRGRTSDEELSALFADARRKPTTWKEFDAYAARVWPAVDETLRGETALSLGRRVKVFWMPGDYTVRDAVLQATVEQAHHLGEVIGALWQENTKPPDMTWIDVRRSAQRTARRR